MHFKRILQPFNFRTKCEISFDVSRKLTCNFIERRGRFKLNYFSDQFFVRKTYFVAANFIVFNHEHQSCIWSFSLDQVFTNSDLVRGHSRWRRSLMRVTARIEHLELSSRAPTPSTSAQAPSTFLQFKKQQNFMSPIEAIHTARK